MSTAAQPETMSGAEAEALLVRQVFAPVYFDKLAQYGLAPQTEEEAVHCLRMGQTLLAADGHEQAKQANTRVDFLKQAEADLGREFERRYGAPAPAGGAAADYAVKVAEALGVDPTIQAAVEAYNAAVEAGG